MEIITAAVATVTFANKSEEKGFMGKVAFTAPRSLISQQ